MFPELRSNTWGDIHDHIHVPIGAFDGWEGVHFSHPSYPLPSTKRHRLLADLTADIRVVTQIFNQLHLSWPGYLDTR